MKQSILILTIALTILFNTNTLFAQGNVGINNTGAQPHPSAMLDVNANDKGMLVPRMTTINRSMIANPAQGLLVFDTTTSSFWFYDGGVWVELGASSGSSFWTPTLNGIEYTAGDVNTDSLAAQYVVVGDSINAHLSKTSLDFDENNYYSSGGLNLTDNLWGNGLSATPYGIYQYNGDDTETESYFDNISLSFSGDGGTLSSSLLANYLGMYDNGVTMELQADEMNLRDEFSELRMKSYGLEMQYEELYASLSAATLNLNTPNGSLLLDPFQLDFIGDAGFTQLNNSSLTFRASDGDLRVDMGKDRDRGYLNLFNSDTNRTVWLSSGSTSGEAGRMFLYSETGYTNVALTNLNGYTKNGYISVNNKNGSDRANMYVGSQDAGFVNTNGANGNRNVQLSYVSGRPDNGYVAVFDADGRLQTGAYVNSSGQGVVFGDVKNFRMEHPKQEGKEIWYASLEGPEAAAYERGTAKLVNGEVFVELPEHFQLVANTETMTVSLTPMSADTYGLAVIEKTANGFKVKELMNRMGNFQFDWEVKCVRKGYEDFRVIRDASEMAMPKAGTAAGEK